MNSMLSPPDVSGAAATIRLPAMGTTVAAEELHRALLAAGRGTAPIAVDASDVESVGQAVLQLLVAHAAASRSLGRPFAITNPSRAFTDRVVASQLAGAIGLDHEENVL